MLRLVGARMRRACRWMPAVVLAAALAVAPSAGLAQERPAPDEPIREAHSDAACDGKPFNECIQDMWPPIRGPALWASSLVAPWFGAGSVEQIGAPTAKRWYLVNLPNDAFARTSAKQLYADSFYTGGFKYAHLFAGGDPGSTVTQNVGPAIGLEVYTASDIHLRYDPNNPPANDRPYASLFYVGSVYELVRDEGRRVSGAFQFHFDWEQVLRLELDVTLLGRYSPAAAAQTALHDVLSVESDTPQGWDSQIGSQLGLDLSVLYGQTLVTVGDWFKTLGYLEGRLGAVHRDATAGVRATVALWGDRGGFSGIRFPETFEHNPLGVRTDCCGVGLSVYRGLQVRYVAYNALLQGGRWNLPHQRSPHTVDARAWVYEDEGGVTLAFRGLRVNYNLQRTGGEIAHDAAKDDTPHWIGNYAIVFEKFY